MQPSCAVITGLHRVETLPHGLRQRHKLRLHLCSSQQVFLALEWVVDNLDPRFVLKTDDDAYVDTAAMVSALRGLCINADCRNER